MGAPACDAFNSLSYKTAGEFRDALAGQNLVPRGQRDATELACVMLIGGVTALAFVPFALIGGLMGDQPANWGSFAMAFAAGCCVIAPGSVLVRSAIIRTTTLAVSALGYAQFPLSLLWLALFTTITIENPMLVAAGGACVLAGNAVSGWLVRRRPSGRLGLSD